MSRCFLPLCRHLSTKRLVCLEGGQDGDIYNLLQLTDADDLDRTAYTLNMKQPRNGFFDTPAFKRIRSSDLEARRNRRLSAFKTAQYNLKGKHKSQACHSRGSIRAQSSSSTSAVDSCRISCTRGFETKLGGKGQKAPRGLKPKRGKTLTRRVKR